MSEIKVDSQMDEFGNDNQEFYEKYNEKIKAMMLEVVRSTNDIQAKRYEFYLTFLVQSLAFKAKILIYIDHVNQKLRLRILLKVHIRHGDRQ